MKDYDLIVIGTGSAMNLIDPVLGKNPQMKIALIDKDEPGGTCLPGGASLRKCSSTPQNS